MDTGEEIHYSFEEDIRDSYLSKAWHCSEGILALFKDLGFSFKLKDGEIITADDAVKTYEFPLIGSSWKGFLKIIDFHFVEESEDTFKTGLTKEARDSIEGLGLRFALYQGAVVVLNGYTIYDIIDSPVSAEKNIELVGQMEEALKRPPKRKADFDALDEQVLASYAEEVKTEKGGSADKFRKVMEIHNISTYFGCTRCTDICGLYSDRKIEEREIEFTYVPRVTFNTEEQLQFWKCKKICHIPEGASQTHVDTVMRCKQCVGRTDWPEKISFVLEATTAKDNSYLIGSTRSSLLAIGSVDQEKVKAMYNLKDYIDGATSFEVTLTQLPNNRFLGLSDDLGKFLELSKTKLRGLLPTIVEDILSKDRKITLNDFCIKMSDLYRDVYPNSMDQSIFGQVLQNFNVKFGSDTASKVQEIASRFPKYDTGLLWFTKNQDKNMVFATQCAYPDHIDFMECLRSIDSVRHFFTPEHMFDFLRGDEMTELNLAEVKEIYDDKARKAKLLQLVKKGVVNSETYQCFKLANWDLSVAVQLQNNTNFAVDRCDPAMFENFKRLQLIPQVKDLLCSKSLTKESSEKLMKLIAGEKFIIENEQLVFKPAVQETRASSEVPRSRESKTWTKQPTSDSAEQKSHGSGKKENQQQERKEVKGSPQSKKKIFERPEGAGEIPHEWKSRKWYLYILGGKGGYTLGPAFWENFNKDHPKDAREKRVRGQDSKSSPPSQPSSGEGQPARKKTNFKGQGGNRGKPNFRFVKSSQA
jgi:hypothetical protein